ncbi:hypothetical protein WJX74_010834 [Apatococcus lobatus]|uniref:Patatin n=1 Tax=Apatococcus lobatus TaxID=904363 RepID=A0AAW1QX45_9CHLO
MDWLETTEAAEASGSHLSQAFTVITEVPSTFTNRTQKTAVKARQQRLEGQEGLLLRAFSGGKSAETREHQAAQLAAVEKNWTHLSQQYQDALQHVNSDALQSIVSHALDVHQAQREVPRAGGAQRLIPAVYALAGGISTCDQADTFSMLKRMLQQQGCYAALLQPKDLEAGSTLEHAFQRLLQQFSGLDVASADTLTLLDWYEDEMAEPEAAAAEALKTDPGTDDMTSPLKRLGLTTPKKLRRSARNDPDAASPDPQASAGKAISGQDGEPNPLTSPMGRLGFTSPDAQRPINAKEAAVVMRKPRERPLALILEHVEGMDAALLQDLITLLSESHGELPITIVMGLSTSPAILDQLLPGPCLSLLQPHSFPLASAPARVDALLSATLLGPHFPGMLPSAELLQLLDDHFLQHDYTTHSYQRGLQVACLHHGQSQPLSNLSAAAQEGSDRLRTDCQDLSADQLSAAAAALKGAELKLEEALAAVMSAWAKWTITLRMIVAAAQATKSPAGSSVRELLRDGSDSKSAQDLIIGAVIPRLCRRIQQTPDREIPCVIKAMIEAATSTWAPHSETQQPLQQLQDLLDYSAQGPATSGPPAAGGKQSATLPAAAPPHQRSAQQAAKPRAAVAQASQAAVHTDIAFQLAALLKTLAASSLQDLPHSKPGAAIFLCKASKAVREVLFAAPRHAIHRALTQPHSYLGTLASSGISGDLEDVCIAFQTLDEMKTSVSMAEWFDAFSDIFACGCKQNAAPESLALLPARDPCGAVDQKGRSSKKALEEANASGSSKERASVKYSVKKTKVKSEAQLHLAKVSSEEMAARFSQASAELQLLGLLRPARKRRGDFAHRLILHLELGQGQRLPAVRYRTHRRRKVLTKCRAAKPDGQTAQALGATAPGPLAVGGGGIFFFWQQGVTQYLQEHFEMDEVPLIGASAGALVATLAACKVDSETALQVAYRLSLENDLFERPLGLAGIWGQLIVAWLDELLPANAADICRDRLKLIVTNVPSFRQAYVSDYSDKQDLIQANMASVHIPFFLDLRPCKWYKGALRIDGSLSDFLFSNNGELLQCGGRSFVMDYAQDTELSFQRLEFMQLRSYESVMQLMKQGRAYAARLDANGGFERTFGNVRKSAPPDEIRML